MDSTSYTILSILQNSKKGESTEEYEQTIADMVFCFLEKPLFYSLPISVIVSVFQKTEEVFNKETVEYIFANLSNALMCDARQLAEQFENKEIKGIEIADKINRLIKECPKIQEKVNIPENSAFFTACTPSYLNLLKFNSKAHINIISKKYSDIFEELKDSIKKCKDDVDNAPHKKEEEKKKIEDEINEIKLSYENEESKLEADIKESEKNINENIQKLEANNEQKKFFDEYYNEQKLFLERKNTLEQKLTVEIPSIRDQVRMLREKSEEEKKKKEEEEKNTARREERKAKAEKRIAEFLAKEENDATKKKQQQKYQKQQEKHIDEEMNKEFLEIANEEDYEEEGELTVPEPDQIIIIKPDLLPTIPEAPTKIKTIFDAILAGDIDEIKKIIKKRKNAVNELGNNRITPLILATKLENLEIIEILCENGADVNRKDGKGKSALEIASYKYNAPIIEYLLKKGANSKILNDILEDRRKSSLNIAVSAEQGNRQNVIDILKKYPDLVNITLKCDITPMHIAAGFDHPDICEKLLLFGGNINAVDNEGDTPLHLAVRFGATKAARFLLKHGADTTIKNKFNEMPLEAKY